MKRIPILFAAGLLAVSLVAEDARAQQPRGRFAGRNPEPAAAPSGPATLPDEWIESFQWRSIGPANMGGRITDIAVREDDPCTWWVATASGGVLKTVNDGVTFEHQFDREATVAIGAIAVSRSNPDVVWVGTGESNPRNSVSWGDGVYKSTDGGATWKNMGLHESYQIGSVAIHPEDENVVYVGALGRLWGPNEERGLFKTVDGGETWEKVLYVDEDTGVMDVAMHPGDPDTLLVATYERRRDGFDTNDPATKWGDGAGLWRTTDGGASFERVTEGLPSGDLGRIGIDWYRADPNRVYVVLESDRITQEPENAAYMGVQGEDADVGARLTEVTEEGPAEEAGLEAGDIVVSVEDEIVHSWQDLQVQIRKRLAGDTVKVLISRDRETVETELTFARRPGADEDEEGGEDAAEATAAAGESAAEAGEEKPAEEKAEGEKAEEEKEEPPPPGPFHIGLGGQRENVQEQQGPDGHEYGGVYRSDDGGVTWTRINSLNPRPMYFSQIRVDPSDDQYLYVLGVSLYRSKDGGEEFTGDGHDRSVHVDHHALWIDPEDGRHMILGNDGGIYVTHDRMEHWDHHNHAALGQFYQVAVDPRRDYNVYGGLQDNGSWGGPNRSGSGSGPVNEDWIRIGGGDGFVCRVDAEDPDMIYMESQNGAMGRYNLRTGERGSVRPRAPRGQRYRWNWNTPFILSSHNSRIHYSAGNHVFRSLNRGNDPRSISPEITLTDRGSGSALAESPRDPGVLYVGTDDGALWMTRDGGFEWLDLFDLPEEEAPAEEAAPQADIVRGETAAPPDRGGAGAEGPGGGGFGGRARGGDGPGGGRGGQDPAGRSARMRDRLMQSDSNDDGKLDKGEMPERMLGMFDNLDANKDGVLDAKELENIGQAFGRGGGGGGFGGRAGRGGGRGSELGVDAAGAAAPGAPAAQEAAGPQDPLSGNWSGQVRSEMIPEGQGAFTFTLKLGEKGKVTGTVSTDFGEGTIRDGKFDAESNKLSFTSATDQMEVSYTATLAGSKLSGQLEVGDGMFSANFTAERDAAAGGAPDQEGGGRRQQEDPDRAGFEWSAIGDLLPQRMWVSSLVASRYKDGRVYATFDGHRSDDDRPYVLLSEDHGHTWRSIRANIPDSAGSVRVIAEDIENGALLFLGTEFSAWVSIDRGASWSKLNSNLPTVAVHDYALHPSSGEIVAGTHGRSIWVLDVTALRQMNAETLGARAHLYTPNTVVRWRSEPSRGVSGTRRFVGENPTSDAQILYSLSEPARGLALTIQDAEGEVIRELEGQNAPGLHRVSWDLRRTPQQRPGGGGGGRFRGGRFAPRVGPGTYYVVLEADSVTVRKPIEIEIDPDNPDPVWLEFEDLGDDWLQELAGDAGESGGVPDERREN